MASTMAKISRGARTARAKSAHDRTPQSLEEALKQGWRINEQLSSWNFTAANKRDGFFFLTRQGSGKDSKRLIVPFVALYELQKSYFL